MLVGMKEVEFHRYWLPPPPGRKSPYLSSFVMTSEDAAKRGALRPEPSTRIVRQVAETPEEEAQQRKLSDTSKQGVGWSGGKQE